jgi:hypothetical protein
MFSAFAPVRAADQQLPPAAAAVRAEALRPNQAADGRPLPLAAQWHMAHMPLDFQIALIRGGHHVLPFIACPDPDKDPAKKAKKQAALARPTIDDGMKQLAAWDMPFAVMGPQWEAVLTDHLKKWRSMPPEQSALVWSATATAATTKPTLKMLGVPYTPELYRGWVQYVMWTVQPRVAREWRSSGDHPRDNWWPQFSQIILAVDLVHADPVLSRFWRLGELVPNRAHAHPFNEEIPQKWKDVDRWFALDTSADPPRPWELKTRLPVFALARVIGVKPQREWLLYAHAPLGEKKGVEITIPEYGKVTADVAVAGSFYLVKEPGKSVEKVGDMGKVQAPPL